MRLLDHAATHLGLKPSVGCSPCTARLPYLHSGSLCCGVAFLLAGHVPVARQPHGHARCDPTPRQDDSLWQLIAYCAGTGGSLLVRHPRYCCSAGVQQHCSLTASGGPGGCAAQPTARASPARSAGYRQRGGRGAHGAGFRALRLVRAGRGRACLQKLRQRLSTNDLFGGSCLQGPP